MFISPFQKWTCPFCFERFHIAKCGIISEITGNMLEQSSSKLRHRFWLRSLRKHNKEGKLARWVCPNSQCGRTLPDFFTDFNQKIIAVLGARSSGKSTYIASLIHQLLYADHLMSQLGWSIFYATDETQENYQKRYYDPLWRQHKSLPMSLRSALDPLQKEPLIYKLQSPRRLFRKRILFHMVLFDAAGEDLRDEKQMAIHNRYIANASGLVFLLDPVQFPDVNDALRKKDPRTPTLDSAHHPDHVLDKVIKQYWRDKGMHPGSLLNIPTSLVFAKSDLLNNLNLGRTSDSPVFQNPSHQTGFREKDSQLVSSDITQAIKDWSGHSFMGMVESTFKNYRFFAVSATGQSPDSQERYQNLNPHRIYDPIFWLAAQWRLIPKQKD